MRLPSLFAVAALAFALSPLACATGSEVAEEVAPAAQQELRTTLTEEDDGKTITVEEGTDVVVKLASNPTTGFAWTVTSTNRTFGYPTRSFVPGGPAIGSGGSEEFVWKTKRGLPTMSMVGTHSVTLAYARSFETDTPPAKTFSFTVKIVRAAPIDDCRSSGCGPTSNCQFCWGAFACVPNGALC